MLDRPEIYVVGDLASVVDPREYRQSSGTCAGNPVARASPTTPGVRGENPTQVQPDLRDDRLGSVWPDPGISSSLPDQRRGHALT